jgi:hypothetical protein
MASAKSGGTKKTNTAQARSTKTKAGGKKKTTKAPEKAAEVVVMDRRTGQERRKGDRRKKSEPVAVERRKVERRAKVNRRRQIDPTTCERDYSPEEIEFMNALDDYKRASGRMFPTCSEILEVIRGLGYEKCGEPNTDTPEEGVAVSDGDGSETESAPAGGPSEELQL